MTTSIQEIYDRTASNWVRKEPIILSDYTGRPPTLEFCEPVLNQRILDLGCGEGYCARQLKERGAASVLGIDVSPEMIQRATMQETLEPLNIQYQVGSATDLNPLESASFDLIVAVFLFNYLSIADMTQVMREVHRLLVPGGRFVFAVPHPMLAFMKAQEAPFYFDPEEMGYFSGRDRAFTGKIWRRDGVSLDVRSFHKVMSDYFSALKTAGFNTLPDVKELTVTQSMLDLDQAFFEPIQDMPLHVLVRITR